MKDEKIAIVVDSGSDIPQALKDEYRIFSLPLRIIYDDREYIDGVDITAQEVYSKMPDEIPSTSLPSREIIEDIFKDIQKEGYTHVLVVTISSKLSGTFNVVRLVAEEFADLDIFVLDSKNISIGSGSLALTARNLINEGLGFNNIVARLKHEVLNSKTFFTLTTLKYLRKGGRIGHVASFMGELLNLKPIITCDAEGVYDTIGKARGWKKATEETFEYARKFSKSGKSYNAFFVYGDLKEETKQLYKSFKKIFSDAKEMFEIKVSPALGVHTGPGVFGIGIHLIDY